MCLFCCSDIYLAYLPLAHVMELMVEHVLVCDLHIIAIFLCFFELFIWVLISVSSLLCLLAFPFFLLLFSLAACNKQKIGAHHAVLLLVLSREKCRPPFTPIKLCVCAARCSSPRRLATAAFARWLTCRFATARTISRSSAQRSCKLCVSIYVGVRVSIMFLVCWGYICWCAVSIMCWFDVSIMCWCAVSIMCWFDVSIMCWFDVSIMCWFDVSIIYWCAVSIMYWCAVSIMCWCAVSIMCWFAVSIMCWCACMFASLCMCARLRQHLHLIFKWFSRNETHLYFFWFFSLSLVSRVSKKIIPWICCFQVIVVLTSLFLT